MDSAFDAHELGDYATALRLFRLAAEQGYAPAQNGLGFVYSHGEGVPQDYSEAVKWYRKAADQTDVIAQHVDRHSSLTPFGVEK